MKLKQLLYIIVSCSLLSLFWIHTALADTIVSFDSIEAAAKRTTDLSRQLLVMIFGNVVTDPLSTDSSMIGQLFFIFNGIVFALAMIWFLILSLKHITRAGHTGQVFSRGGSPMSVVGTVGGFLMLVPTVSGWSLAQLLFLWAVSVMGIGSANLMTDKIVDLLDNGYSLLVQPSAPGTVEAARGIYEMNLCKHAINSELASMYSKYGNGGTPLMAVKALPDGFEITNGNAKCGSVTLPQKSGISIRWHDLLNNVKTEDIYKAQQNAMKSMQQTLGTMAKDFVSALINKQKIGSGTLPDAESDIHKAAQAFESAVNMAIKSSNQDGLASVITKEIKTKGWLALGSWYQTFATANQKVNYAVALEPIVHGLSGTGELGAKDTLSDVMTAYQAQLQNSTYTPPLGEEPSPPAKDTPGNDKKSDPSSVFVGVFKSPGQKLANYLATDFSNDKSSDNGQINPLLKMKNLGDYVLNASEISLGVYTAARFAAAMATKGVWGAAIGFFTGNTAEGIEAALEAISPFIYFLIFLFFAIGFTLSVYLPMIPFIFWFSAAANWVVSVLVGVTGGSLWAATHIATEEGNRSTYGYIFLIDAQIRPMLMVLGFVFASLTIVALGTLLNIMLAATIANVQANSLTGIVSIAGILMIYARICTTTVTRVFALQVTMPDYIISWLGGREAANILGGLADETKNIFSGFSSGLQRMPGLKHIKYNPKHKPDNSKDGIK